MIRSWYNEVSFEIGLSPMMALSLRPLQETVGVSEKKSSIEREDDDEEGREGGVSCRVTMFDFA